MKVVINACFGGFSLSPRAVKRLAELNGRECYFYKEGVGKPYKLVSENKCDSLFWAAFDIPNINDVLPVVSFRDPHTTYNALYSEHRLDSSNCDRRDPKLVQVVEELGAAASGSCAKLKVVEVPDGVEWEIDEYDGREAIHEVHRSWS
jgi:hypothetical protein